MSNSQVSQNKLTELNHQTAVDGPEITMRYCVGMSSAVNFLADESMSVQTVHFESTDRATYLCCDLKI